MRRQSARGVTWNWTPEVWPWNPSEGPWKPEFGRPKDQAYLEVCTSGVRPRESYDYWCETVFYNFEPDPRPNLPALARTGSAHVKRARPRLVAPNSGFQARVRGVLGSRADFFAYESDAVTGQRSARRARADDGATVDIGLILAGRRIFRSESETEQIMGPGTFFLYDPAEPSRIAWTAHRGIHLTLRRDMVRKALGGDLPPAERVPDIMAASRLAPFIRSHLQLLAARMDLLPAIERAFLIDQIVDLLLTALRNDPGRAFPDAGPVRQTLFIDARRFIEQHFAEPDLNIDRVAQALGCSRSTLYRSFAEHNLSVPDFIRQRRLQRFMQLLHTAPKEATITSLAQQCGFLNIGYFSKQFRQHFGMSPTEARHAIESDHPSAARDTIE